MKNSNCAVEKTALQAEDLEKMQKIHSHWDQLAKKYGQSHSSSWQDINMIRLEIANLLKFIQQGDYILDAGCSNGFTTFEILKNHDVIIHGVDFCETSIMEANARRMQEDALKNVSFSCGNVLDLQFEEGTFDKVMGVRVIINLPSFSLQKEAIKEIHRVLKPNGLYLMSEAFAGSLENLNKLRSLAALPPLQAPEFNLYLEENKVEDFLKGLFRIEKISRFSSLYYVGTRFFHYLARNINDPGSYENEVSNFFKNFEETPASGDFGIQKLYLLRKI